MGSWRTLLAGVAAVFVVVGGVVVVSSEDVKTPAAAQAESMPPEREPVTVEVQRTVLADRLVTRGTVASAGAIEYTPPAASTGTSRLEVLRKPGEPVAAGDVVALVDGRPVFVLEGDEQLGADITPLSVGPDVERLQAALRSLGSSIPSSEDGTVGAATQEAIRELYENAGFRVDTTTEPGGVQAPGGESLELKLSRLRRAVQEAEESLAAARVVAGNQPDQRATALIGVAAAQRKVREAEAARAASVGAALETLAAAREAEDATTTTTTTKATSTSTPSGPGGGPGESGLSAVRQAELALRDAQRMGDDAVADARTQLELAHAQLDEAFRATAGSSAQANQQIESAELALQAARQELAEATRRDGVIFARSEALFVPRLPTTVLTVSSPSAGGAAAGGAGPLFTLRSGALVVEVNVPAGVLLSDGASGVAESDDGTTVLDIEASTAPVAGGAPGSDPGAADTTGSDGDVIGDSTGAGGFGSEGDTTPFVITGTRSGAAVAGDNLRVTVSTPVTTEEVTAVPLRAVATGTDGTSFVRVANGDSLEKVTVRAGRTGNGMVELLPAVDGQPLGVEVGDRVRVS